MLNLFGGTYHIRQEKSSDKILQSEKIISIRIIGDTEKEGRKDLEVCLLCEIKIIGYFISTADISSQLRCCRLALRFFIKTSFVRLRRNDIFFVSELPDFPNFQTSDLLPKQFLTQR